MDFSFSEEQEEVQGLARRILGDRVTEEMLRRVEGGGERFDRGLWQELGAAGLLGIGLPSSAGGGGLGLVEQCLVLEEVGRT
ncbi:MAG TPA: acyl-CoA dehydrogenase family protein, partial [Acidimicrobiales bacterium]